MSNHSTTARRRGRPPTVSEGQILIAAAKQSRGELTMAAVATELGVTPATLYKYFADKQALLLAVYEAELDRHEVPETDDWREYLLAIGEGFFGVLVECPALLDIGPWIRQTEAAARFVDRAFELMSAAGFAPTVIVDAYGAVDALAYNRALTVSGALGPVDRERFSALTQSVAAATPAREPAEGLRDQLNLIMDGVAAQPHADRKEA